MMVADARLTLWRGKPARISRQHSSTVAAMRFGFTRFRHWPRWIGGSAITALSAAELHVREKKRRFAAIAFCALTIVTPLAGETMVKTALLLYPGQDRRDRVVEFRWDEDEPLRVAIRPRGKDFSTRGNLLIYSDDDRIVPAMYVISDPTVDESRSIARGELVRLYLDSAEMHLLPRSGDYYEVAYFVGWSGDRYVVFVTKRRWFTYRKQ